MSGKTFIFFILTVGLIVSLFFNYQYYQTNESHEAQFNSYVSHVYKTANDSEMAIQTIFDEDYENLTNHIAYLNRNLYHLSELLSQSPYYMYDMPRIKPDNIFDRFSRYLESSTLSAVDEGELLSEAELEALESIHELLEDFKSELEGDHPPQPDQSITKHELDDILQETIESNHEELLDIMNALNNEDN